MLLAVQILILIFFITHRASITHALLHLIYEKWVIIIAVVVVIVVIIAAMMTVTSYCRKISQV